MKTPKNKLCSWPNFTRSWLAALSLGAICVINNNTAQASENGSWINPTAGGLWSDTANWSGGVIAGGADMTAYFDTLDLETNNTVVLDTSCTLGCLVFGDAASTYYNWTLSNNGNAANVLTLEGTTPSIDIEMGNLTNNVVLAGTSGLTINGGWTTASYLVFGTNNTLTGDIVAANGIGGNLYLGLTTVGGLGGSSSSTNFLILAATSSKRSELLFYGTNLEYPSYNSLIMSPTESSRAEVHTLKGSITWNGSIILDGATATTSSLCDIYSEPNGTTLTINGNITATNDYMGQMTFRHNAGTTSTGIVNGNINVPSGTVAKNDAGAWTINSTGNSWLNTYLIGGTLKLGVDNALALNAKLTAGGGTLDLNGHNQTVEGGLTGTSGKINNSSTNAVVLTVNNSSDSTYGSATIQGNLSLVKQGAAKLTLSGANTYTGDTLISNGTLTVTGSINKSTNIIIGPGAILGGLTMTTGQELLPTDRTSIIGGTVNVGSGSLVLNYVTGTPALIVSNGNLSLSSSSSVTVNVTGSLVAGQSYLLTTVTANGQVSGTVPSSVVLNGVNGVFGSLVISDSQLYLVIDTKPFVASQTPTISTNLVLFAGAKPTFSVTVGGLSPFGYAWYINGVISQEGTNSSMTCTGVSAGTLDVYCVVTNDSGSATSKVWTASVIAAPSAMYPSTVLSNSPIGYWRLNEPDNGLGDNNTGVVAHDYCGGNNALYSNTVLGQPGYNQTTDPDTTSALFGNVSTTNTVVSGINTIDFAAATNNSKAFTVEAWVSGDAPSTDSGIVAKGYGNGGEQFCLDTGGANYGFRFFVRDAGGVAHVAASSIVASAGVWYHLVGICDEPQGVVKLYVNGQSVASATISTNGGILNSTSLMSIGARYASANSMANNSYDNEFVGYINDVSVYNYALTSGQVMNQYSAVGIAPFIITQPAANTTINKNGTFTASAVVGGTQPLSYSWFDINANSYIDGQTNATLVISNLQVGGAYYLTIKNAYGTMDSDQIFVDVVSGFTASMVPSGGSLSLYSGTSLNFSVTASGDEPIYYHWFTNGVAVSGQTNASYVLNVPLGTRSVSCLVSNSYNGLSSQTLGPVSVNGIAVPTNSYQLAVISDSPVAYWPLFEADDGLNDGNAGVVACDYVGGHNGTYTNVNLGLDGFDMLGNPQLTSAQFGVYAATDSLMIENDTSAEGVANIDFAQPSGSNGAFSVEAWVNYTTANNDLVSKGNGHAEQFALDMYNGGFRFFFRDATAATHACTYGTDLAAGTWYHVVGVVDGANGVISLYVNGSRVSTASISSGIGVYTPAINDALPSASLVNIGSRTSSTASYSYDSQFVGKLANVALYNYALSTNQIADHYSSSTSASGTMMINALGNGQIQIVWNFNGLLQSSTNVAGPYNTEVDATSPYTVPATNALMFYRVKQK